MAANLDVDRSRVDYDLFDDCARSVTIAANLLRARAVLALILFANACTSADVNAPKPTIRSELPTVRSEIYRGHFAVFSCVLNTSPNWEQINECGRRAIEDQEKKAVSAPFLLGAYLETWSDIHMAVMLRKTEEGERNAAGWLDLLRRQQEKTGISGEQMCQATDMDCDALQRDLRAAEFSYGAATRDQAR